MYRLVVELLQPHLLVCLWVGWELVMLWRQGGTSRRRLRWLAIPLIVLAVITTPLASFLALATLESAYPAQNERPTDAHAIVVLAGDLRPQPGVRKAELGVDTLYRCLHAAEVYSGGPKVPVVVSGGVSDVEPESPAVALVMRDFLAKLGVAEGDLVVEDRSRSTYENAVETAKLLKERGIDTIVLVTDAAHLRRASACFEKQGIQVVPSGCRYRAPRLQLTLATFLPDPSAARGVREAWHEWLGIAWYWLSGRI